MPMFVTIGYGDRAGYDTTDQDVLDRAHAHDRVLLDRGGVMGVAGGPVVVRNHDGAGTSTEDGPYADAPLPVAGFGLLEADSLEEAVALAAGSPCAVAHGVVEVWPLDTLDADQEKSIDFR